MHWQLHDHSSSMQPQTCHVMCPCLIDGVLTSASPRSSRLSASADAATRRGFSTGVGCTLEKQAPRTCLVPGALLLSTGTERKVRLSNCNVSRVLCTESKSWLLDIVSNLRRVPNTPVRVQPRNVSSKALQPGHYRVRVLPAVWRVHPHCHAPSTHRIPQTSHKERNLGS